MDELKSKIEAILFAVGKKISVSELMSICKTDKNSILASLQAIKQDYDVRSSPMMVFEENDQWKLTVREAFLPVVQSIVADTELTKATMETLAVIAWHYPIRQSDIIKIRSNKAYEHMKELEETGFIIKEKSGRSFKIKLTEKFYEYFDLPKHAKPNEAFKDKIPSEIVAELNSKQENIQKIEAELEQKSAVLEQEKKGDKTLSEFTIDNPANTPPN